jgi:hypothetical protein
MPHIENLGLWPDWGVGHKRRWPSAQYKKTFLVLRPFEGALTCSILIAGTPVMLRKAYFLRRVSWLRPEFWTPRPRIQNSGPFYWTFSSQLSRCYTGRKIAHRQTDRRTDGRHNDFSRAHFLKMFSFFPWQHVISYLLNLASLNWRVNVQLSEILKFSKSVRTINWLIKHLKNFNIDSLKKVNFGIRSDPHQSQPIANRIQHLINLIMHSQYNQMISQLHT